MTVNKLTLPSKSNAVQEKINEIIDNFPSGTTVDQTFDGTSANPQSGVAIEGELSTNYQPKLVSGTNIKTINSTSLLGNGDISIVGLPSQTSQSGKFLTTNGTSASWANALPFQSGNNGKILTTNGSSASWNSLKTLNSTSLLGSGDIPVLQNTATGTNSLTILGNTTSYSGAINIGTDASSFSYATALGYSSSASGNSSIALGRGADASALCAIQLGYGTNSTGNSLNVGFYNNSTTHYNYQLLDGTTGLIPYQRINHVTDNNSGNVKFWTGTQAEYDAITTKDADTLYYITDNTSIPISILEALYPVGAIYIGTMSACPLQTLGVGTWQLVAQDRVLQGAGTRGTVGTTINESLPNIIGDVGNNSGIGHVANVSFGLSVHNTDMSGAFYANNNCYYTATRQAQQGTDGKSLGFDASRSSSTYQNNAPVQQDGYLVNIWERIS